MSNFLNLRRCNNRCINRQRLKKFQQAKEVENRDRSKVTGLPKPPNQHRYWLQRNRIDGAHVQRSVGVMERIELKEATELAPHLCPRCGVLMLLIGCERHPVEASTDLLTYCCIPCDDFLVLPTESPANI